MSTFSKSDILEKSVILIGPMCSGKSTISFLLYKKLNMPHISLDNKEQLSYLYKDKDNFQNKKAFDLYVVRQVLSNLQEASVIDFGSNHSIYEDRLMFDEVKRLLDGFKNVVLLRPCSNDDKASKILRDRKLKKLGKQSNSLDTFSIYSSCNLELATIIQYTDGLTFDMIVGEILANINK